MTRRSTRTGAKKRKPTVRKSPPKTLGDRIDEAIAQSTARAFAWLGRNLVSVVALVIWPIRVSLITLGASAVGFWQGARDEYRLIREEWRQDRIEQQRLIKSIEVAWQEAGLTTPEARARAANLPDDQNPDLVVNGTALTRKAMLKAVGMAATEKDDRSQE